jgi:RNA polymerase sigma-70 factor, ECF subfamily
MDQRPTSQSESMLKRRSTMPIDPLASRANPDRAGPSTRAECVALVEEYADQLVRYAFRQVRNLQDAEDIVQDVFARFFATDRHDQVISIGSYLYRAVANASTDFVRCRMRSPVFRGEAGFDQLSAAGSGPLEAALAAEEGDRAEALLRRLPPEQAEAIRLRVFDGLRLDQIAEVLDCPINTVSSRLRYGFQKLREAVGKKGAGHELP